MKAADQLIGDWVIDENDIDSIQNLGNVLLSFSNKGILSYKILDDKDYQVIIMTFEVYGNEIITNQPSSPNKEKTKYRLEGNKLELEFNGVASKFTRLS